MRFKSLYAAVIPFPLARRRTLIDKQARYAAELNPDAAERHIAQQVKIQSDVMRRRGVVENIIEHELKSMESAIRARLLRAVSGGAK